MEIQPGQPRLFTLEEANSHISCLQAVLPDLQQVLRDLAVVQETIAQASAKAQRNGAARNGHGQRLHETIERAGQLMSRARSLVEQVEQIGCELKDVEQGLVDFRAVRHGRVVYLCWRLGEDRISYWHELDTGFAGRKPL